MVRILNVWDSLFVMHITVDLNYVPFSFLSYKISPKILGHIEMKRPLHLVDVSVVLLSIFTVLVSAQFGCPSNGGGGPGCPSNGGGGMSGPPMGMGGKLLVYTEHKNMVLSIIIIQIIIEMDD